jgi:GTP-binding protein Era
LVFIDTPGIHKPQHRMNHRMVDDAIRSLRDADAAVLIVDASSPPGSGDRFVVEAVRRAGIPTLLALNKIDLVHKPKLLPLMEHYARAADFKAIVPISALTGDGERVLESELLSTLPEGEPLYPEEFLTDQTERTLAAELVREKVLHHMRDELPFATAVVIDRFEEPKTPGTITRIFASILVDHESQKPIVVGQGGSMIKRIGTEARLDLEAMLDGPVYLDLHVKVRQDWRDDERLLDELLGKS